MTRLKKRKKKNDRQISSSKGTGSHDAPQSITDSSALDLGFSRFLSSHVRDRGETVDFCMKSGAVYSVPAEYVRRWFRGHENEYERRNDAITGNDRLAVVRSRRLPGNEYVRVVFSDGYVFEVAWDTVLMACEPRYEHYGGLTDRAKALIQWWSRNHGPFLRE